MGRLAAAVPCCPPRRCPLARKWGAHTFTAAQLYARILELDGTWSEQTLQELLAREALAPHGTVVHVQRGVYRPRSAGETTTAKLDAASAVLAAMHTLAGRGRMAVTRRDIEDTLAVQGLRYSGRSVRAGLLQLRSGALPSVTHNRGYYVLTAGER